MVRIGEYLLRKPEPGDLDALWAIKNDPAVAAGLGGFSTGWSHADMLDWLETHRTRRDEVMWAIVHAGEERCAGHVALYGIDPRVGQAELGILIGGLDQGRGLGRECTAFALGYAFQTLNLRRVHLSVLATNARAQRLYEGLGFSVEGRQREADYRGGQYVDVVLMGLLRSEWTWPSGR